MLDHVPAPKEKPVSLHGLTPEEALRALLAIDPGEPPDDESNPEETEEAPAE